MIPANSAAGALTSPVDRPYSWFRLAVSMLIAAIGGIGMWAYVLVLPAVEVDFGVDRAGASLPFTLTQASMVKLPVKSRADESGIFT